MEKYLISFYETFLIASPYMILGLVFSGLLHAFLPEEKIKKWFSGPGFWPIFRAALLGVPLPLCSCSVIPASISFRKSGASRAATSAFLISTPESGLDSIALTYGMMGLPMAILRPIAALISALLAGFFQVIFNKEKDDFVDSKTMPESECCSHNHKKEKINFFLGLKKGIKYAFFDLIEDMAFWFFIGLALAAFISALVPIDVIASFNGVMGKLGIILLSIPLYICASAATPVAAALIAKGLSPGGAILFLLLGPATNITNLLVLQKFLGKKAIVLNLLAIFLVSIFFSYLADIVLLPVFIKSEILVHSHFSLANYFFAVIFGLLLLRGLILNFIHSFKKVLK